MRQYKAMKTWTILTSLLPVILGSCPVGWEPYDNSCYRVFGTRATFDSALRRCAGHQGFLLSVKSEEENSFIQSIIERFLDDQFWIGIHFNQTSWYWLEDGTEVTWSRWAGPKSSCALMTGTQTWMSENCVYFHQYICEQDAKPTTEASTSTTTITQASTKRQRSSTITTSTPHTTTSHRAATTTSRTTTTTSRDTTSSPTNAATTTTTELTTTEIESSEKDVTPEVVVVDRKKNPGRTHSDNRPSAIGIGSMGVGVLIFVFLGVFLLDASKLWRDFAMFRHNMTELLRSAKRPTPQKKLEQINTCTSSM